jgi:hypothetical protein
MSKILGNKARTSKPVTNVGEIHVPPTAFHRGASQSGGDKINSPKDMPEIKERYKVKYLGVSAPTFAERPIKPVIWTYWWS